MDSNPICIHRATTLEEAEILVAWLEDQGVAAKVLDPDSTGVFAFGVTDTEGVEIFVADEATATKAKELIAEHERKRAEESTAGPIAVACDECGHSNQFPADTAGKVQACTECGAYIDVPGK